MWEATEECGRLTPSVACLVLLLPLLLAEIIPVCNCFGDGHLSLLCKSLTFFLFSSACSFYTCTRGIYTFRRGYVLPHLYIFSILFCAGYSHLPSSFTFLLFLVSSCLRTAVSFSSVLSLLVIQVPLLCHACA